MDSNEVSAIERLIAKDEIVDLVHRYSYCVDHRLYDEVVELFAEDCVVDYGPGFPHRAIEVKSSANVRNPDSGLRCNEPPQCERPGDVHGPRSCVGAHIRLRLAPADGRRYTSPVGLLPRLGGPPSRWMAHC